MHRGMDGGTRLRRGMAASTTRRTHVRVRSRVGTARLRGDACMRAWWVREVINCETHGAGARDLCKVPVHTYVYTVRQCIYSTI